MTTEIIEMAQAFVNGKLRRLPAMKSIDLGVFLFWCEYYEGLEM